MADLLNDELPDSWDDHENIPDDAKGSNEEIEDTEQLLKMRIEDQVLVGTTCFFHNFYFYFLQIFRYYLICHFLGQIF